MSVRAVAARAGLAAIALGAFLAAHEEAAPIFGFNPESIAIERRFESRFLSLPSERNAREFHRVLTALPHPAGSERNRELARWQREHWQAWGLEDVHVVTHHVLLPSIEAINVERVTPVPWVAEGREEPIDRDPDTMQTPGVPYHAYSASGDRTGVLVYAGAGNPEQYDWLEAQGIELRGRIAIVRHSVPYSYRGFKVYTAQQRGLAAILVYSDPADDGSGKGATYPDGPWGPDSRIQRGSVAFDFLAPGDPLTPGWASLDGARRIDATEAAALPRIASAPLSQRDARVLLESIGGPDVPSSWRGALPIAYRAGGRDTTVRVRVRTKHDIGPVDTVIGRVRGREFPDQEVILGNHRDAWVFGGVDPSSGSASLMEMARSLGTLLRQGYRPRRTIVLASWDAEELSLTSSTEWGEQFAGDLRRRAVAYLNVDSAASGRELNAAAVPSLVRAIAEAARDVREPGSRVSLAGAATETHRRQAGSAVRPAMEDLVRRRLGSGSDYAVFLYHLGIPVADLTFAGPYGVYHSIYDSHQWVERFGDPGFRYHAAMTRLWGLLALRLANADVLPLDYEAYADALAAFVRETSGSSDRAEAQRGAFAPVLAAIERFRLTASALNQRIAAGTIPASRQPAINVALMKVERAFIDDAGLRGRPWYRHVVFAPQFSYAPEVLPAVAEALRSGDTARVKDACERLGAAIDRATAMLAVE